MSQTEQIKKHLETGKPLDPMQALNEFGCFRLSARIHDLRAEGMNIDMKLVKKGQKSYARYQLSA